MNVRAANIVDIRLAMVMAHRSNARRTAANDYPDTMGGRLMRLRADAGMNQDTLAGLIGISRSMVTKYEQDDHDPKDNVVKALARVFGVPPEYLRYGRTGARIAPVRGLVGAGGRVEALEIALGRDCEIPASWDDAALFEISGDSCWPVYENRDVIVVRGERRFSPAECLGKMCVVETADGLGFVKRLRRGSSEGLFTLESPNLPPIEDVRVLSARPVRLHIQS